MQTRKVEPGDWQEWLRMRSSLWPELLVSGPDADSEAEQWLARTDAAVFVAVRPDPDTRLAGFIEIAERPYADGCSTSPVAFLEAWYVDPDLRHTGIGRQLVESGVAWALSRGLREFASDTLVENTAAQQAHQAVGFSEVERAVRYRRSL